MLVGIIEKETTIFLLLELPPFSFTDLDLADFNFYVDWFIKRKEKLLLEQQKYAESKRQSSGPKSLG